MSNKAQELLKGLDDDYIDITHLRRMDPDTIVFSNPSLVARINSKKLQMYVIGLSEYGCFVGKAENTEDVEFQFFGFIEPEPGKITPKSTPDFSDILDVCNPDYLEGLLFHLDVVVGKKDKNA